MSEVIEIDGNALLEKYGNGQQPRRQRLRKNVQLLFLGLTAEETAPLITLLRTSRISPRGKQVNSEQEFLDALSERSWDLILCTIDRGDFSSKTAISHLKRLDKDIPVIQIIPSSDSHLLLQGLKNRIQAVVPLDEKELVLINIRRELDHLEHRRRLRKAEAALAEAEKRAQHLQDSSKNAIACLVDDKLVYVNDSFLDLFGIEGAKRALGKPLADFFNYDERAEFLEQLHTLTPDNRADLILQLNAQRSDRSEFTANLELSPTEHQNKFAIRALFRVDDHHTGRLLSEDLDFVSGLYNKDHLQKQLEQITQKALRGGNDCCLLYIQLDQLAQIKAKYGHEGSDQLIRDLSSLLRKRVNRAHLLTHPEEDTFVIVFNDPNIQTAQAFAEKLCSAIGKTSAKTSGMEVQSTCTVGITVINDNTPPQDEVIARAKSAIESFKEESPQGNGVRLHIPHAAVIEDEDNEFDQIRNSIENNDFRLLFQPIVNLVSEDQESHHYEVLLRLLNESEDELSPNDFMSAIGDAETAIKVDRWVIEHSLKALKKTLSQDHKNVLFMNISAHALADQKLFTWLSGVLRKNNIPAERLVFQISESDISISPNQAKHFTEMLHKIHCKICIKHFGSIPNSEGLLNSVDADYIKFDGSFIQELGKNPDQDEQLFNLAQQLSTMNKVTIAPLVENTKAMANLWKAGVDYVQGYYLQPPREKMDYDFFPE